MKNNSRCWLYFTIYESGAKEARGKLAQFIGSKSNPSMISRMSGVRVMLRDEALAAKDT